MAGELDKERYQTIYARHDGSVAAPTAGLHFTERIFGRLKAKGIGRSPLTLHVGAGTFKPVSSSTIGEHVMHEEHFEVSNDVIRVLADPNIQPVAVGTTSLRTLESLYWIAYKILFTDGNKPSGLQSLSQWEHITFLSEKRPPRHLLFASLLQWMDTNEINSIRGKTGICITPGYPFQVIKALATNFHQPKSTLLLLIAAICGDEWKRIYNEALDKDYRFLSYGDGSLLFPDNRQ
jgi:S-adenosylmethionine:tRNA ribosyltransferase-isomerase